MRKTCIRRLCLAFVQGTPTAANATDGPRVSPLEDHTTTTKSTQETSQAMKIRPGQIQKGHDLIKDSTIQANMEAAC